ncbi:hypothetical protein GGU10DRAFT_377686 [Lentinula aff. detonsa]|uniref:Uncharacterized protein n=1 Tax=Lentinula aff. detonsa TaxID=2804958 RepID=A0AA38NKQ9_9AGAR|nr:hypothetical protein GGU10DRAFT_377686 [Lentinula aff. detonsa]
MRAVFAILLVLELFGALAYAMPRRRKGKKGKPQLSGSSATSTTTETKDETSTPVFLPSHWVNTPYENCNAEQTEMINNWIMDAYNMTYEADRITHDDLESRQMMAHLALHTKATYPVLDYFDHTMPPKQAAYDLKTKHMQFLARKPPGPYSLLPTLQNAESYAATIVDFYLARRS